MVAGEAVAGLRIDCGTIPSDAWNLTGRIERQFESLGAISVDEQPISLEDALIAHVGRQGDKSFLLNASGGRL